MSERERVIIYTDGACLGNPGPGGYAAVVLRNNERKELSGGFRLTTNNRMEILAAIVGLETLKAPSAVTLYSDSRYLVDAIMLKWAIRWRANGWRRNKKDKAVNVDLWERLLELCSKHEVTFLWVKGHAGNKENERCDWLAWQAASSKELPADRGYESAREPVHTPSLFD